MTLLKAHLIGKLDPYTLTKVFMGELIKGVEAAREEGLEELGGEYWKEAMKETVSMIKDIPEDIELEEEKFARNVEGYKNMIDSIKNPEDNPTQQLRLLLGPKSEEKKELLESLINQKIIATNEPDDKGLVRHIANLKRRVGKGKKLSASEKEEKIKNINYWKEKEQEEHTLLLNDMKEQLQFFKKDFVELKNHYTKLMGHNYEDFLEKPLRPATIKIKNGLLKAGLKILIGKLNELETLYLNDDARELEREIKKAREYHKKLGAGETGDLINIEKLVKDIRAKYNKNARTNNKLDIQIKHVKDRITKTKEELGGPVEEKEKTPKSETVETKERKQHREAEEEREIKEGKEYTPVSYEEMIRLKARKQKFIDDVKAFTLTPKLKPFLDDYTIKFKEFVRAVKNAHPNYMKDMPKSGQIGTGKSGNLKNWEAYDKELSYSLRVSGDNDGEELLQKLQSFFSGLTSEQLEMFDEQSVSGKSDFGIAYIEDGRTRQEHHTIFKKNLNILLQIFIKALKEGDLNSELVVSARYIIKRIRKRLDTGEKQVEKPELTDEQELMLETLLDFHDDALTMQEELEGDEYKSLPEKEARELLDTITYIIKDMDKDNPTDDEYIELLINYEAINRLWGEVKEDIPSWEPIKKDLTKMINELSRKIEKNFNKVANKDLKRFQALALKDDPLYKPTTKTRRKTNFSTERKAELEVRIESLIRVVKAGKKYDEDDLKRLVNIMLPKYNLFMDKERQKKKKFRDILTQQKIDSNRTRLVKALASGQQPNVEDFPHLFDRRVKQVSAVSYAKDKKVDYQDDPTKDEEYIGPGQHLDEQIVDVAGNVVEYIEEDDHEFVDDDAVNIEQLLEAGNKDVMGEFRHNQEESERREKEGAKYTPESYEDKVERLAEEERQDKERHIDEQKPEKEKEIKVQSKDPKWIAPKDRRRDTERHHSAAKERDRKRREEEE